MLSGGFHESGKESAPAEIKVKFLGGEGLTANPLMISSILLLFICDQDKYLFFCKIKKKKKKRKRKKERK